MTVKESIELFGFLTFAIPLAVTLTLGGIDFVYLKYCAARDKQYDTRERMRSERLALR